MFRNYLTIGLILFCCSGIMFLTVALINKDTREVALEANLPPGLDTDYKLGEYYANHDEDPAGPYDLGKARRYYDSVLAEDPKYNEFIWYQLGRLDFIEGKHDDALRKFDRQIEYFGDALPNVYYMIGLTNAYKASEQNDEESWVKAEKAFIKYISYSSTAPYPRVDLAWIYFAQGNFEAMVPVLEEGLVYHPDNAWLLNMYGLALLNNDNKESAHEQFVLAGDKAAALGVEDWGLTYPGNDPEFWGQGLSEFRDTIAKNIELSR